MALDDRLERLFQQSVENVDGFLQSIVPGLECPSLCLRDGRYEFDDFLERYDAHLRGCSKKTRNYVLACIANQKKSQAGVSEEAEAFVLPGIFDVVYYTPVFFERNSADIEFQYTFHHEVIHARHQVNYSRFKKSNSDELLLSFFEDGAVLAVNGERDEHLVDCTMAQWFESEDNRLTPIVKKYGLAYLWRMALNHEVWEKF